MLRPHYLVAQFSLICGVALLYINCLNWQVNGESTTRTATSIPVDSPLDITYADFLTHPDTQNAQTLSIDIPAVLVKVNTSHGPAISLGKNLIYIPGKGLQLLDHSTTEAKHVREVTAAEIRRKGITAGKEPLCAVVLEEKIFPRRFIRVKPLIPRTSHSVDLDITVVPEEIAVCFSYNR